MVLAGVLLAGAEPPATLEYQVKAVYLYNFAKFIEWPEESGPGTTSPLFLGVLRHEPMAEVLEQVTRGQSVRGRAVRVLRTARVEELKDCHILFIGAAEEKQLVELLRAVGNRSVLTVGEGERFAHVGGVINFTLQDNKVRFEINLDAADRARLKISSKLLRLATVIRDQAPVNSGVPGGQSPTRQDLPPHPPLE